jgi:uncharacterized protein YkwD
VVDKIKGLSLNASIIKSKKHKKWFLPALTFLIVVFLMAWNASSYAHSKTIKVTHVFNSSTSSGPAAQTPTVTPVPLTPTPTPSPTPTVTPVPPTPIPPKPTVAPTVAKASAPVVTNSTGDYLLAKVNEYRKSLGLYEVKSDSNTCDFANKRAGEIVGNFNHDGFKNLPYPSVSKVTENIAMEPSRDDVVNAWINSAPHAENMRADTPFVCIGNSGNYYAYEGWKP